MRADHPPERRWDLPWLLATWFGAGLAPVAPGTAGSLAGLIIAIILNVTLGAGSLTLWLMSAALLFPGIWAASVVEKRTGTEDPGLVVVDEVIGQWITLAAAPAYNWKTWLLAFALFRVLDILKPPPARQCEKLPRGWGIVADDVMSGLYGALGIFVLGRAHII